VRSKVRLTLIAVAVGTLLAGVTAVGNAIANGENVANGTYRFSAALSMPEITRPDGSKYASACSGALIAADWVITAGHCLHDGARNRISGKPRYEVLVTVGRATLSGTGGETRRVVTVRQSATQDVALVKLDRPVRVQPAIIATAPPTVGETLRITGWGSADAEADLSHRPDRMQTGLMKVTSFNTNGMLVDGIAPQTTTSACPFDSGAPYFRYVNNRYVIAGTEVGGPDCPHNSNETTTRLDTIATWILTYIRGTVPPNNNR